MSRFFYLLCLTILISVSVSACPNSSPSYQSTTDTIHIDNIIDIYGNSQNDILVEHTISIGREVVLALPSNPTTGYSWYWMNEEPALPSLTYLGCSYNRTQPLVGGGGIEYWGFRGSLVGTTSIPLAYRQPWKGGAESKHVTIQLHVKSNGIVPDDTNMNPNGREKFYNNGYTLLPSAILILSLGFLSCCL